MCVPPHLLYSVLGVKPGALCVLGKPSTNRAISPPLPPPHTSLDLLATSHSITGTLVAWLHNLLLSPPGFSVPLPHLFPAASSGLKPAQTCSAPNDGCSTNQLASKREAQLTLVFPHCECFPEGQLQVTNRPEIRAPSLLRNVRSWLRSAPWYKSGPVPLGEVTRSTAW